MTVSTLRPNGTTQISAGATLTGGATAHAVLSDNSDASYVTFDTLEFATVNWTDLTLPAGAVIKSIAHRVRVARVGASSPVIGVGGNPPNYWGENSPSQPPIWVTWTVPTTITAWTLTEHQDIAFTDAYIDAGRTTFSNAAGAPTVVRLYEAYLDVTYVTKPVVDPITPTGTVDDTNQPLIEWNRSWDLSGGTPTHFEVKVFTDAQYGAGGFNPATSTPTANSGIVTSSNAVWQVDAILADDTYRAYVRIAQTVNGVLHWSDWDFVQFDVLLDLPAVPTFTATPDNANARIILALDDNAGDVTTDFFEVQRSLDGGATWGPVRQLVAGLLLPVGGAFTLYDYEAPNGVEVAYRARALHDYTTALAASAWAQDSATWSDGNWWVKHPHRPDLNMTVVVRSFPEITRAGRQGVFQPLGAPHAIVVSDTRGPVTGTITLRVFSIADQDALDELLDMVATLLIQAPANERPPGYVRFHDQARRRIVDWADATRVFDQLTFTVVDLPPGDVVAWP